MACRTGPGTVSCGSLSESLSATILSMESRLTGMSISMVVHHVDKVFLFDQYMILVVLHLRFSIEYSME